MAMFVPLSLSLCSVQFGRSDYDVTMTIRRRNEFRRDRGTRDRKKPASDISKYFEHPLMPGRAQLSSRCSRRVFPRLSLSLFHRGRETYVRVCLQLDKTRGLGRCRSLPSIFNAKSSTFVAFHLLPSCWPCARCARRQSLRAISPRKPSHSCLATSPCRPLRCFASFSSREFYPLPLPSIPSRRNFTHE